MKKMTTLAVAALCGGLALSFASVTYAQAPNADVAKVLKRFDNEPTVRDTQMAAMRYAVIDTDRMENWLTRVRMANVIPGQVRAKAESETKDDGYIQTREDLAREDTDNLNSDLAVSKTQTTVRDDDDNKVKYTLQADWDIHKIIFNPDELDVASETARQVKLREQVLNTATKIYFERRRMQVEQVLNPPADTSEAILTQLRIDELTADLDAITGGWYSANIR